MFLPDRSQASCAEKSRVKSCVLVTRKRVIVLRCYSLMHALILSLNAVGLPKVLSRSCCDLRTAVCQCDTGLQGFNCGFWQSNLLRYTTTTSLAQQKKKHVIKSLFRFEHHELVMSVSSYSPNKVVYIQLKEIISLGEKFLWTLCYLFLWFTGKNTGFCDSVMWNKFVGNWSCVFYPGKRLTLISLIWLCYSIWTLRE